MKKFLELSKIPYEQNKLLSTMTSWKIGGPADWVCYPEDNQQVSLLIKKAKESGMSFFIIGNGTNILAGDSGYRGMIIKLGQNFQKIKKEGNQIVVGGAFSLPLLALKAAKWNLGGLSFLSGIPGTVGGAVIMNAGAWGLEIKDVLVQAVVFDCQNLSYRTLTNQEMQFSYRSSLLQKQKNLLLTEAVFSLQMQEQTIIEEEMSHYKKMRLNNQPYDVPNAGSVFKNPPGYSAGKLIESAGLKGCSVGGAQVSQKHANFIINTGGATAEDVLALILLIEKTIFETNHITLEKEIIIL